MCTRTHRKIKKVRRRRRRRRRLATARECSFMYPENNIHNPSGSLKGTVLHLWLLEIDKTTGLYYLILISHLWQFKQVIVGMDSARLHNNYKHSRSLLRSFFFLFLLPRFVFILFFLELLITYLCTCWAHTCLCTVLCVHACVSGHMVRYSCCIFTLMPSLPLRKHKALLKLYYFTITSSMSILGFLK